MADEDKKENTILSEDEVVDFCLKEIKKIKSDNLVLNKDRADALKYYRGEPEIIDTIAGRSKVVTTDLQDLVEWAKPSLLEIFASGDQVVNLEPASEKDVPAVNNLDLLINHQLMVKNNWFMVLHDWFDDMLKLKTGVIKYQWHEVEKSFEKEYEGLTQDEFEAKIREENIEVVDHKKIDTPTIVRDPITQAPVESFTTTHDLTIKYTIKDEYPLIEACPSEDVGFSPRAREIKDTFVYHKVNLAGWEFKKKYGKKAMKKAEATLKDLDDDEGSEIVSERYKDLGGAGFIHDDKKNKWVVYECYYRNKKDGTPTLTEVCGEHKLTSGKNKYDKPPFHAITPIRAAHRVNGYSFYDLVKELQKIRTALLRQILDNVYFANNRRYFGDPTVVNMDDYLNNNFPGAFIRTIGDPRAAVVPEEKAPLPPELFQFWEMLNTEKDYHSGLPRSFQGVNPSVLNKTFRGQAQQVTQAAQRMQMMARLIAEIGIAPLMDDIVDLNIRFLKKKTMVRSLGQFIEIAPDNIVGHYDAIVNVGLGHGSKQETIQNMQQLLGLYAQALKMQIPIVTADNAYFAVKELVKAMGYRNTADFVTDPKLAQSMIGLVMLLMQKGAGKDPQMGPMLMMIIQKLGMGGKIAQMMNQMKGRPANPNEAPGSKPGADVSQAVNVGGGMQPTQPSQPVNPGTTPAGGGYFG